MDTEFGNLNGWKAVNKGKSSTKCSQRRGQGSGNAEFYRARSEFRFKSQCKRPLRDFKEQWYNLISVCKYHHCYENNEFQRYKIERKMIEGKKGELFQYFRQEIMWVELEQHQWRGKEVDRFKIHPQLGSHITEFKKYITTFLTQHKNCLPEKFALKRMVFSH